MRVRGFSGAGPDGIDVQFEASFLKALTEASPDAIIVADERLQIVFCNRAACDLFGYGQQELRDMSCALLVPEDIRPAFEAFLRRAARSGEFPGGVVQETRCVTKAGSVLPIETSNFAWRQNGSIYFGTIFHDISPRKQAEDALERERRFLQNVFDATADGLLVSDARGNVVRVNRRMLELLGCSEDAVIGRHPLEYVSREGDTRERSSMIRELLDSGVVRNYQAQCQSAGGASLDVEINMVLLRDDTGEVTGSVSSIRDVSERRDHERRREALLADLQRALETVKQLKGLLPICSECKKIRDDRGYWQRIEQYIAEHSEADFTHSICPECARKLYPGFRDRE